VTVNEETVRNPYVKRKRETEASSTSQAAGMSPNTDTSLRSFSNPYARLDRDSVPAPAMLNIINPRIDSPIVPSSNVAALVISAAHKAGMDGVDRTKIDAIILKESGNSKFMQQQRKRDETVNQRIERLREKLANAPLDWRVKLERQIDVQMAEWIAKRHARAAKVVVDMDMFYMACELLDKPHLRDVPAVVGGPSMICTSNYVARKFGVRSAMPGYIGEALVDQLSGGKLKLVYCKLNFDLYKAKSKIMRETLSEYDPNLSAYSLDEAYLDISHYLVLSLRYPNHIHEELSKQVQAFKDRPIDESIAELLTFSPLACQNAAENIVQNMRRHVQSSTGGLTCSAGSPKTF
jgi:DNA polymerase kappa